MRGSSFSHKREMGSEAANNMRIVLCKVRETKEKFLEPKACVQRGSIPMAKPERTEKPVMLVKPMAKAPPASSRLPNLPMHTTKTMFLMYPARLMAAIGTPMSPILLSSSTTYSKQIKHNENS